MTRIWQSKTFRSQWCGRAGEQYGLHHDASVMGRRVIVHTWLDGSGEVEISAMRGDGRMADSRRFYHATLSSPTAGQIAETITAATAALPAKGARLS